MNDQQFGDFLIALGQSFADSLSPAIGFENIVPQDAYEVFIRVFGEDPSPEFLASLSEYQLDQIRSGFESCLECKGIAIQQVREAVGRTLARWPAGQE